MPRRSMLLAIVLLAVAARPGVAVLAKVTPTQQVINMLTEMKAKGGKMLDEEQKTYSKYAEWVDDKTRELEFEIQEGTSKIEELIAFITKADSDVAKLGREIADLDAEITKLEAEKAEAAEVRKTEHEEYLKLSQDYGESVSALQRAIQVLSSENYDRAQAVMLLQRMSTTVPGMPRVLATFLQERGRSSFRGDGAPEVAAYDFQSGGILELLEGLYKKFKGELADVEESESNQAHGFELVKMHLSDTIARDTSDKEEKAVMKGKKAAASARAKGELSKTKAEKAADEKLMADVQATFQAKTAAFKENQKVRAEELEAISKAIEIISSPEVAGSYAKHINLAQQVGSGRAASLLQMGRRTRRMGSRQRAAELLNDRARALDSRDLAAVAAQVTANPFEKVIGMVESLIEKLKEQAAAEAEHKAWCDEQLKANKLKRNKKTAQANKLTADVEGLAGSIADMGDSIDKLVKEQALLTKAMEEATAQREAEKSENTETVADAAAGLEAVKRAMVVLGEFYSSQTAFLQQVPEMDAYKGMQSSKGGVMGMLQVIETDFARLKAETEASEKAAASEYDAFMDESTASKKQKHEAEVQLRLDKDQAEYEKVETEKDLAATEKELAQAKKYYDYLKPNCVEVHVSYEERVARRKEEIEALKEAYAILDQKSAL